MSQSTSAANNIHVLQQRLLGSGNNVSIDLYKEIMIKYLLAMKITEAKFVWQNLPVQMKADLEFQQLFKIASSLNSKKYREFHSLCRDFEYSPLILPLVLELYSRINEKNVRLIENAYKSISFDDIESTFDISSDVAKKVG